MRIMDEFKSRLEKIESILQFYLPKKADWKWSSLSFETLDPCINESHFANLIVPCENLISLGGKRWRPLLAVFCAELAASAKTPDGHIIAERTEAAYKLAPLIEFAHTASLIHDDIEDSTDERRGKPAAHITYGMDVALNAASWLYFQAATCIKNLSVSDREKSDLYELFLLEMRRLHLGQAIDIKWHREPSFIPTADEYMAMVKNKTGTLARLATKIGILAGGGTHEEAEKCGAIAEEIGVGFQILDDVTNLTTGNPGKRRGDDIVEGKKSLPVITHIKNHPEDLDKLASLFGQARREGIESPAVEETIKLLEKSESIFEAKTRGDMIILKNSNSLAEFYGATGSDGELMIKLLFKKMMRD